MKKVFTHIIKFLAKPSVYFPFAIISCIIGVYFGNKVGHRLTYAFWGLLGFSICYSYWVDSKNKLYLYPAGVSLILCVAEIVNYFLTIFGASALVLASMIYFIQTFDVILLLMILSWGISSIFTPNINSKKDTK